MTTNEPERPIYCSFCGVGTQEATRILIVADGANICDECVEVCVHLIRQLQRRKKNKVVIREKELK